MKALKSETDFQAAIIRASQNYHICQAESKLINPGIFDLNLAGKDGREHWIELKWKYTSHKPKIRISQVKWGDKRSQMNYSCWMITGSAKRVWIHHVYEMGSLKMEPWDVWEETAMVSFGTEYFLENIDSCLYELFKQGEGL